MASVFNKITGRYIPSAHLPDYNGDWIVNPDVSQLIANDVPQRYWKAILTMDGDQEVWTVGEMTQEEKDAVDTAASNKANITVAGQFTFETDGIARNKWLGLGNRKPSNVAPYVAPQPIRISAITFINTNDEADVDVVLFVNGIEQITWEIRNSRWAYKATDLFNLQIDAGDRVSLFCRDAGDNASNVLITVHYSVIGRSIAESSGATI